MNELMIEAIFSSLKVAGIVTCLRFMAFLIFYNMFVSLGLLSISF